jgi:pyruvate ferredoxin oxidoreductase alpha subunit
MVVTTDYPFSAHRVSYLHNLFQNGAPTLSGLVEVFHEKKRRGEIRASEDITFIMITGDGGMDIGLGPTLGTAIRNHRMIILEYDNQGYMNTGGQLSYSTPRGHRTATSHTGRFSHGHRLNHRDTPQLMAASGIPYVFTAIEDPSSTDLIEKAAKAQWYSRNHGLAFGKILVTCPLNWKSEERLGFTILKKAVESCFFPLYDVQNGKTRLSYDPDLAGTRIPVSEWLKLLGKSAHLTSPQSADLLKEIQDEIDWRWERLKAKSQHPLL